METVWCCHQPEMGNNWPYLQASRKGYLYTILITKQYENKLTKNARIDTCDIAGVLGWCGWVG